MFVLLAAAGLFEVGCLPPHCDSLANPGCCNSGVDSLKISTQDFLDFEDYLADGRATEDPPSVLVKVYRSEQVDENLVAEREIPFHNNVDAGPHFADRTLELDNDGGCHFWAVIEFEFDAPDSWDPTVEDEMGVDVVELNTSQFEFEDEEDSKRYDVWDRIAIDLYFWWWIS